MNVDTDAINHLSLCSGYGGIDLGLKRAIGRSLRTVAYVEVESFAVANLVAKASQELLDEAPVWSDLRSFPWGKFHGLVDILSGGYPCQPFSAAGKRLGAEDPRHLWPHISAGIALMRPAVCFFENVEGHISLGLPDVLQDLVGLGYKPTWCVASASEVGAPHQRKRVFILAYRDGERGQLPDWWRVAAEQMPVGYGETWRDGMANAVCERRQQDSRGASCHEKANGREGWDIQQQDGYHVAASHVQGTAWPSRPGEQQFAWEPPRVVANDHGPHAGHGEQRPERTLGDLSGGCGEAMGNAAQRQDHGREPGDVGTTPSQWRCGDHAADGAGEVLGNAAHTNRRSRISAEKAGAGPNDIWRRRSGESGEREIKSPLGGCVARQRDGLVLPGLSGLSHQELAEIREWMHRSSNRTDELRLLGNGVVPATAERAFRVLVGELRKGAN